jgi:DNA-binding MarR family transcriptional regulator
LGFDASKPAAPGVDEDIDLGPLNVAWRIGGPERVALRLSFVAKLFDRYLTRQLSESGLTVAEWRVMAQLAYADDSTVRELARQAWVDRAEVSRAAASLERKHLLVRHPNTEDKRQPKFSLTQEGRDRCAAFQPQWTELQKLMAGRLKPQELALMNRKFAEFARLLLDVLHDED